MRHVMRQWTAEILVGAATLVVLAGAARRVVVSRPGPTAALAPVMVASQANAWDATQLPTAGEVALHNPFRLSRRPSRIAFGAQSPPPEGPRYRPQLRLSAVIGGPPWKALIVGVPGQRGPTIVSIGETIDSLTVIRIARDTVRLRGPDTTWTLVIARGAQ